MTNFASQSKKTEITDYVAETDLYLFSIQYKVYIDIVCVLYRMPIH